MDGYDVSQLSSLGVGVNTSTIGASIGTSGLTRGLLVSSFDVSVSKAIERVNQIRSNLEVRRVTNPVQDFDSSLNFPLDMGDSNGAGIGDFLASIIGEDTGSDVGGGQYKHRFQLLNSVSPPILNFYSDKDSVDKEYIGFRAGSMSFEVNANESSIPVSVSGILAKSASIGTAPTLSFASTDIVSGSQVTAMTLGGSSVDLESVNIEITREQERIRALGSSEYIKELISGKAFMINLTLNGIKFNDETERNKWLNRTSSSMQLTLTDESSNILDFYFPEIYYTSWTDPSLNDTDVLRQSFTAMVTGDATNWYVDLTNTHSKRYDTGAAI